VVPGGISSAQPARGGSPASAGSLSELLSAPLPGTRARSDDDLARRLEGALAGFDGVETAHVLISRQSEDAQSSPGVAVQLHLSEDASLTPAWLSTVCAFCIRTIPGLDATSLTVVDDSGRTLHEDGRTLVPAVSASPPQADRVVDETFRFGPGWLWAAAGAGFLLVVTGLAVQLLLRSQSEEEQRPVEAGSLSFLSTVPIERVVEALRQERPQVLAVVTGLAPEDVAERLREHGAFPDDIPTPTETPAPEMTDALARELRARLVRA
jgi:hypothetical protein